MTPHSARNAWIFISGYWLPKFPDRSRAHMGYDFMERKSHRVVDFPREFPHSLIDGWLRNTRLRYGLVSLTLAVLAIQVVQTIVYYQQTGTFLSQDYEYFSDASTSRRLHDTLPGSSVTVHRLTRCPAKATFVDWSAERAAFLTLADVLEPPATARGREFTIAVASLSDDDSLLEFVWDYVLLPANVGSVVYSPKEKRLGGLRFVLVDDMDEALRYSVALVVGAEQFYVVPPKHNFRYGLVFMARENCNSHVKPDPRLMFGFLPYGDCALMAEGLWSYFPLGVQTPARNGFDMHMVPKPARSRRYLLNLVATFTSEKPTRMQAYVAALDACKNHECVLGTSWSDVIAKQLTLRRHFGGGSGKTRSTFSEVVADSVFTLAPAGNNPEQYRIWEAMIAGSIPIIEDKTLLWQDPNYVSPAYGHSFMCTPRDSHHILHMYRAPVLFVNDWRTDLPRLLASMSDVRIAQMQRDIADWMAALRVDLQVQIRNNFVRSLWRGNHSTATHAARRA